MVVRCAKNPAVPDLVRDPLEILDSALDVLDAHLDLALIEGPETHVALAAVDIDDAAVPHALGRYLVGVVSGAVDIDAQLSRELLAETPDEQAEARAWVLRLLGTDNTWDTPAAVHRRDHIRNPWIAEIITHVLLMLRRRRETLCLVGDLYALKLPHMDPLRQGLDLIGIFELDGSPALAIAETKATKMNGAALLNDAAAFFAEVDAGLRGVEIRQEVHALKHVLPDDLRSLVGPALWEERSCYLPSIIHFQTINEHQDHPALGALRPDISAKRLLALRLSAFHEFFDDVADEARASFTELLPDV
jgi:hypothetical protein